MTRAEVVQSLWGQPNNINTSRSAHSVREQWVYTNEDGIPTGYLYFRNGRLTDVQEIN